MKQGWTYKTLGDITTSMADGPFGSNLKKEHYTDKPEVRIIQLSNIGEDGWREENTKYTTFEHLKNIQRSEVQPGDIVIAKMMPAGRAILCPSHEAKFVLSSDAVRATLIEGVNRRFVLYSINSPYFRKQVYENVSGSGRVRTSLTKLKACRLLIPGINEQERIVERLDAAFAQIDELKSNAEKQLAEARALFQSALKEMLEPKEGWEIMKLGEFAYMKAGNFVKASEIFPDYKEGLYPCYGGNGFRGYVKEPNQNGDYCMIGRQGALCGCINRAQGIFRTTEHAVIVKPYKDIPTSLVYYMLVSLNLNKYATGAAQPGLSVNNIAEAVIISVPPYDEQQHIADTLDSLKSKVDRLQENFNKMSQECDALKQALLRQIFE